ncbi:MAG: tryptophan--tRNA ligase [Lentisphaerae bacterium RIFOXYB12_FULL_65_16]|nr:MAG: tryptophan--tRNA ligase [Lentisphaerae bacterium RIFOXYA12_64_32]OGV94042.1 MAG: tryptophan--tRNA ligase [Lentisphaerae bacterium RIFOXYB12_FULL_65_16]
MSAVRKRVLSGIQPSGDLHLGNYFGMMRPAIELQEQHDCFYFIADYHALTQLPDPAALRERSRNVAIDFLACGLDPAKTVLFRQSDVPQVSELMWVLACLTPLGLLERCHSYKDKIAKGLSPNHGLFSYPVLMAADILVYGSHIVPVGRDQKQHVEVTRDLAIRFNNQYGEVLTIPDCLIREEVAVVPGVDGEKMSKSYGNTIELFGDPKAIKAKIMRIVTDSTPMEAPKDPSKCNVFALYRLLASEQETEALRQRYLAGGMGYGHAKQALHEKYTECFKPFADRRRELADNPDRVEGILQDGAARARAEATKTMAAVRRAIGLV